MTDGDAAAGPKPAAAPASDDMSALAKGGRTNIIGFLMRLVARLPFLFIAGRMYGPEALGRFAYAILIVELVSQLATLGLRRGLAEQLSKADEASHTRIVFDALLVTLIASLIGTAALIAFPEVMFPNSGLNGFDRLLPLIILALTAQEIALAALAYRYDIGATVRARAIVEPWTISIASLALWFYSQRDGLILSYVIAMLAATVTALIPLLKSYGLPRDWRPNVGKLWAMARRNTPLAAADAIEWGSRRLDLAILGLFATPAAVGIYYIAQQVASIPQKLKTSFDPILAPVITRNLGEGKMAAIAQQIGQVGFWIIAAQLGLALMGGIPAEAVMGTVGPEFVGGAGALVFLLIAEVFAATAVVSEAVLVYVARHRNLMISAIMLGVQAALSVALILAVQASLPGIAASGWVPAEWKSDNVIAAMPALALALALALSSLIKARLLTKLLDARVNPWRWPLAWATLATGVVGWLFTRHTPEWMEIVIGVPVITLTYIAIIWFWAFGPEDRILFKKTKAAKDCEA